MLDTLDMVWARTASSFMKHVADRLMPTSFYAGPAASDRPLISHKGTAPFRCHEGQPKALIDKMVPVDAGAVQRVYGARLKAVHYHNENINCFSAEAAEYVAPRDPRLDIENGHNYA